jgi:hypothetical protein
VRNISLYRLNNNRLKGAALRESDRWPLLCGDTMDIGFVAPLQRLPYGFT